MYRNINVDYTIFLAQRRSQMLCLAWEGLKIVMILHFLFRKPSIVSVSLPIQMLLKNHNFPHYGQLQAL